MKKSAGIGIGGLLLLALLALAFWRKRDTGGNSNDGTYDYNGTLIGRVTDASSAKPIAGALVRVGTLFGGETDADGRYRIAGISPATYLVVVSAAGYESKIAGEITLNSGDVRTLDIALSSSIMPAPSAGGNTVREQLASIWEYIGDEISTAHKVIYAQRGGKTLKYDNYHPDSSTLTSLLSGDLVYFWAARPCTLQLPNGQTRQILANAYNNVWWP